MHKIPAICDNPLCKIIFPSGFAIDGGLYTFVDCKSGPCPRCGSIGTIPTGKYEVFKENIFATLFHVNDIDRLQKIKGVFKEALSNQTKTKQINNKISEIAPEITDNFSIVDWTRENELVIKLVIQFLTVLISALALIKSCSPVNITHETIINQTFNQFYEYPAMQGRDETQLKNKKNRNGSKLL